MQVSSINRGALLRGPHTRNVFTSHESGLALECEVRAQRANKDGITSRTVRQQAS
jgi:hypothetical protein